jgi:ATP-dependent Clp protease adaptor protein ClpS
MKNKEELDEKVLVKEPSMYKVIMHNDDFTTQEFVMELLMDVFDHNANEASSLMMAVHIKGRAMVGVYQHEIAELKVQISHDRAMSAGHPFKLSIEEE